MKWRNEQIFHLRQSKVLFSKDQNLYFNEIVYKLFFENYPKQILFSLLENNSLVAYGGLVHINWKNKTAEISFLTDTKYKNFALSYYWKIFFKLIEEVKSKRIKLGEKNIFKKILPYYMQFRFLYSFFRERKKFKSVIKEF